MFRRSNPGRELTERQIMETRVLGGAPGSTPVIDFNYRSTAALSVSATSLDANRLPSGIGNYLGWVLIDPFKTTAEVRGTETFTGNTIAWTTGLSYAHSANAPILFLPAPVLNVKWWGALGDGSTDDTTAINNAITQLANINGTLLIPGNSTFEVTQINLASNICIQGDGYGSVIQNTDTDGPAIYGLEKDNITIRNIRVYGGSSTGGGSHVGISINDSDNVIIEGNWVHGFQHAGILVRGDVEAVGSKRVKVINNDVYSIAQVGIFVFRASDYAVISGNTVHECGDVGIGIDDATSSGWADTSQLCSVVGNIVYDNTDGGIQLEGAQGVTVVGNVVYYNGRTVYFGATQGGIGIGLSNVQQETACAYNVIASNVIRGNRKMGISLQAAQYNIIEGNLLINNLESGPSSIGNIHLQNNSSYDPNVGSSYNKIVNNYILNKSATTSAYSGIRIDDSDCTENEIRGNTLRDENSQWTKDIANSGTNTIIATDNIGIQVEGRTFTNQDATPSVKDRRPYYQANYTGATDVTNLTDGTVGQRVFIRCGTGNITFKDISTTGSFELAGGTDYNHPGGFIEFIYARVSGGTAYWREVSRGEI